MVIGHRAAHGLREIRRITGRAGRLTELCVQFGRRLLREILVGKPCVASTHHIEQYSLGRPPALGVHVVGEIFRAHGPGILLIVRAVILGVDQEYVYSVTRIFNTELTCGLQQYGHTAGAVVGSVYRLLTLGFIGILVGPGAGVVMCKKQQPPRFLFRVEAGEDVARMQHSAIESRGVKTLFMYLRSAAFQFRH